MADMDTDDDARKPIGWRENTGGAVAGLTTGAGVSQLIAKKSLENLTSMKADQSALNKSITQQMSEFGDDVLQDPAKKAEFQKLAKQLEANKKKIKSLGGAEKKGLTATAEELESFSGRIGTLTLELEKRVKNPLVVFKTGSFLTKVTLGAALLIPAVAVGHIVNLARNRGASDQQQESFVAREQEKTAAAAPSTGQSPA
jgi:hypothetical protein